MVTDMSEKKRFIAGAVCPRCGAMDRIVMYTREEKQYRECVSCGFNDEIRVSAPPQAPETRLNQRDQDGRGQVRPVKIVEP